MKKDKLAITSITCNRPALFSKSLSGIAETLTSNEIDSEIIACDDSLDGYVKAQNKEIVKNIRQEHKVDIKYCGNEEKERFIQALKVDAGNAKIADPLEFAFFGDKAFEFLKGPGANRNASLLACVGRRFISFDDDTDLRFFSKQKTEGSLEISTKKPDLEFAAFAGWKQIEKVTTPFTEDALGWLNKVLGAAPSEIISECQQQGRPILFEKKLDSARQENAPVKVVMAGICGGRWYSRPFGIYFADGALRKLMFRKKRDYEHTKCDPIAIMHAQRFILSSHQLLISTAFGVDAREMVPPFIPHIRNQDTIWGMLMKLCYRGSLTAHLPFAIYHDSSGKTPFQEEDFTRATADTGLMTSLIIGDMGRRINKVAPEKMLQRLGNSLISFSCLSHGEWAAYLRSLWLMHVGTTCIELEKLLEKYKGKPSFWAKDAQEFMDTIRGQALESSSYIPREFLSYWSEKEAGVRYRDLLYKYGELLVAWPLIWESAQKLNAEGRGLSGGGTQ